MITAFIIVLAGFSVFKKWVVLFWASMALATLSLTGCGYKGALYIPETPEQSAPNVTPDGTEPSLETPNQPASTSGASH